MDTLVFDERNDGMLYLRSDNVSVMVPDMEMITKLFRKGTNFQIQYRNGGVYYGQV